MIAAAVLAAFAIGYALAYFGHLDERKWLRAELRVAQAQIAHAVVKDGATIPPRIEPLPEIPPLSARLRAAIEEWEGPEAQANTEANIRKWLGEGHGEEAILRMVGGNV